MLRTMTIAVALGAPAAAPAAAQSDTTIQRGADVLRDILAKPAGPAPSPSVNDRGDLATVWMTPVLRNRFHGSPGTPVSFFLYAVNPDGANALTVSFQCYNAKGEAPASYSGTLELAPLGYTNWAAGNAKNVNAVDNLWCALSAPSRFAAYASSREGQSSEQIVQAVALAR